MTLELAFRKRGLTGERPFKADTAYCAWSSRCEAGAWRFSQAVAHRGPE